jgi:copper chaperone CopZ
MEKGLEHLSGVVDYEINYLNDAIKVDYDPQKTTLEHIRSIVQK